MNKITIALVAVCWLTVSITSSARAGEWLVTPDGTGDTPTIQEAIDQAAPGDTVLLGPGTYFEHLLIEGKGLTLIGEQGMTQTVLDGENRGRILKIVSTGEPVHIRGLTFRSGVLTAKEDVGAAIASFVSPVVITDCHFQNNLAWLGGAVFITFWAEEGGGLPSVPVERDLSLTGCSFVGNIAGSEGGAVFADDRSTSFTNCTFRQNSAGLGGGVGVIHNDHRFTDCEFVQNIAKVAGGGLSLGGASTASLTRVLIDSNQARNFGGGLRSVTGISVNLTDCWFLNNQAANGAGADFQETPVFAERVLFAGGIASDRGGGVRMDHVQEGSFLRCTWSGNASPSGASLSLRAVTMSMTRCVVGDADPEAVECLLENSVTENCNVGGTETGGCFNFVSRVDADLCANSPQQLCMIPETSCGPAGHADETCPSDCSTPVDRTTWGALKNRYR